MDITNIFLACVKLARLKNKSEISDNAKYRILPKKGLSSKFAVQTKDLVGRMSSLKKILLENRQDYLSFSNIRGTNSGMTDLERDQIDENAERILKQCSLTISAIRKEVGFKDVDVDQFGTHQVAVIEIIQDFLKSVSRVYAEQRAIRVNHALEKQKLTRLQPDSPKFNSIEIQYSGEFMDEDETDALDNATGGLSAEEIQMFEEENQHLFEDLNSITNEVRQIEGKVIEISRLQQAFSEMVLQQDRDIEVMANTVVGTTETIRDANDEIRKAMKNNAGFRVWILFFLIVLSFSLLFLDWYNP